MAASRPRASRPGRTNRITGLLTAAILFLAAAASAQEQMLFPAVDNAHAAIIQKIRNEQVRIDVAVWYLIDREITQAMVDRFKAGVPVRVIGDRVAIFEIDPNTKREFEFLASNGIPIRLRYHPTWFPEIMHWKSGIFVGQNTVEFGSANWTGFELMPWSSTNFKDETVMFTNDSAIVQGFLTKFDQMWVNTTEFKDWPEVYKLETGNDWTTPMNIQRVRLEPDYPSPPGMIWSQGPELNNAMAAEIDREGSAIDLVVYRLSDPVITDALVRRRQAGIPVRVFVEPNQYRQRDWPEYWLTGAHMDRLWMAGAQIKQRTHEGLTHMKTLITSNVALNGSSNFTRFWQRDHNYFIPAQSKPSLHLAMKDRFQAMWQDTANYTNFRPLPPEAPALVAPAALATGVSTTPTLTWNRAPWATSFDVYLGTSASQLAFMGRVNAQLVEDPPQTYSWTPAQPLQTGTTYYWRIVSRTLATDADASLVAASTTQSFTTSGSGGGGTPPPPGPGPFTGTPIALPGTIQAEDFDNGGQGVAYSDSTAGNSGGQYRNTDVDIEGTSDTGGGFNVGWMAVGEWLKYTVNVGTAGTYTIEVRVAAARQGGTFHIEADGVDKTGPLTIPDTGGWQNWTTVTKTDVSLAAGQQVWKLVIDSMPAAGVVGNLNYVRVVAQGTPGNTPPTVSLTSPANGATFTAPATINLAATASDTDGTVSKVDFYQGTTLLGTDTTSPYSFNWTNVPAGTYTLKAVATDNGGATTQSATVNVTVQSGTNTPPTVTLTSPANGATFTAPATINLGATASDSNGTVTKVDFYSGTTLVGTDTTSPYSFSWTNVPAGTYTLKAVATDNGNATGESATVTVTVQASGGGGSTPFTGTPVALPGTVEAENFDNGGQNVAYFDNSAGNAGGAYRTTDVDIAAASDTGGGYTVGWVGAGEWLNYTVNVTTAGTYDLEFRVATAGTGGTFRLEVNGVDKTGAITVPDTGGWQNWATIRKTGVSLSAGQQIWRLVMLTNGPATSAVGNFNWLRLVAAGTPPPPPPPEIVIYGADVPTTNIKGSWSRTNDATAAAGVKIASTDTGFKSTDSPIAAPANYFDVTFNAQAGVRYRLWLRMSALGNDKFNDSVWVQFSGSTDAAGNPVYRLGTTNGLNVNLATCSNCALSGWGWQNGAYWLPDTGDVWFAASGPQTIRIQLREDGVAVDQIVLSPDRYLTAAPGPVTNDSTIVPKS